MASLGRITRDVQVEDDGMKAYAALLEAFGREQPNASDLRQVDPAGPADDGDWLDLTAADIDFEATREQEGGWNYEDDRSDLKLWTVSATRHRLDDMADREIPDEFFDRLAAERGWIAD